MRKPPAPAPMSAGSAPVQRILLVDDDVKLSRLTTGFLEANGYEVGAAFDGASGLERALKQPWDLVVLDVMLPQLDGFQFLIRLRETSTVPVLMLTGRGSEDDRITGLEHGADDYLPKTASARELLARIRALLRRSAMAAPVAAKAPQAIEIGALKILPDAYRAELAGAALELTPVEFDLLRLLAQNRGKACPREALLETLRRRDFDGSDRSIDVHVASLRRKLGDDPREPRYIQTVRTVGYMMLAQDKAA